MKKILSLMALVLALFVLASCAKTPKPQDILGDILKGKDDNVSDIIGGLIGGGEDPGIPNKGGQGLFEEDDDPAEPYYEYTDLKNALISNINQTIYMDPDLGFSFDPSFENIYEVDVVMWPSAMVWEDESEALWYYGMIGYGDIEVKRNKDGAVVSYVKDNGSKVTFTGVFDEVNTHYTFDSLEDNGDHPYLEIIRTSFGYAAQVYTGGIGMLNNVYLISVSGEGDDGIIGVIRDTEKPGPLNRNLPFVFPKEAGEWYHFAGGKLTGISRSGESFEGEK